MIKLQRPKTIRLMVLFVHAMEEKEIKRERERAQTDRQTSKKVVHIHYSCKLFTNFSKSCQNDEYS